VCEGRREEKRQPDDRQQLVDVTIRWDEFSAKWTQSATQTIASQCNYDVMMITEWNDKNGSWVERGTRQLQQKVTCTHAHNQQCHSPFHSYFIPIVPLLFICLLVCVRYVMYCTIIGASEWWNVLVSSSHSSFPLTTPFHTQYIYTRTNIILPIHTNRTTSTFSSEQDGCYWCLP